MQTSKLQHWSLNCLLFISSYKEGNFISCGGSLIRFSFIFQVERAVRYIETFTTLLIRDSTRSIQRALCIHTIIELYNYRMRETLSCKLLWKTSWGMLRWCWDNKPKLISERKHTLVSIAEQIGLKHLKISNSDNLYEDSLQLQLHLSQGVLSLPDCTPGLPKK